MVWRRINLLMWSRRYGRCSRMRLDVPYLRINHARCRRRSTLVWLRLRLGMWLTMLLCLSRLILVLLRVVVVRRLSRWLGRLLLMIILVCLRMLLSLDGGRMIRLLCMRVIRRFNRHCRLRRLRWLWCLILMRALCRCCRRLRLRRPLVWLVAPLLRLRTLGTLTRRVGCCVI